MIVCAGEALIDLLPTRDAGGAAALRPVPGGSPFNVAVALGRLGVPVAFLGAVSRDPFGSPIMTALAEARVSDALVTRVARPSPLAVAHLDDADAEPRYSFYDAGTAARGMTLRELKPLPKEMAGFHFGSLALGAEPAASSLLARASMARRAGALVSLDPNARPGVFAKETAYRRFVEAALAPAALVKLSQADLAWLRPGLAVADFARERLGAGASVVVLTRGAAGAVAFTPEAEIAAAAVPVAVVDTIGAGDAFMAGLLASLHEADVRTSAALAKLGSQRLEAAMRFAAAVAALACTRAGADPPWREEVDQS